MGTLWVGALNLALALGQENLELPVRLPTADELGFRRTVRQLPGGETLVRIEDPRLREVTEMRQRPDGTSQTRHLDPQGNLLKSVVIEPFKITEENHQIVPATRTLRMFSSDISQLVETQVRKQGVWQKVSEYRLGPEASMSCNAPMGVGEFNRRIADLNGPLLSFAQEAGGGDYFNMTNNLRAENDCNSAGPALYPDGGALGLMHDLEAGLDQGLRCINNLGRRFENDPDPGRRQRATELRRAARTLMGNFAAGAAKRFTITCEGGPDHSSMARLYRSRHQIYDKDTHAVAMTCVLPNGTAREGSNIPGIAVNSEYFRTVDSRTRQSTLFHEMLHHIPIFHAHPDAGPSYDQVYGLQFCCFGIDRDVQMPPSERGTFPPNNAVCDQALSTPHGTPTL